MVVFHFAGLGLAVVVVDLRVVVHLVPIRTLLEEAVVHGKGVVSL